MSPPTLPKTSVVDTKPPAIQIIETIVEVRRELKNLQAVKRQLESELKVVMIAGNEHLIEHGGITATIINLTGNKPFLSIT